MGENSKDAVRMLESGFVAMLAHAKSNLPEHKDGAQIYNRFVKPQIVSLSQVGAHYAIASLFQRDQEHVPTYCYSVERQEFEAHQSGGARMALGRARVTSEITLESQEMAFGVLHLGDHNINAGVKPFVGVDGYPAFAKAANAAFQSGDLTETLRIFDRHFGTAQYSLKSLLGDERKHALEQLLEKTLDEAAGSYRQIYERHAPVLRFLGTVGMEQPRILRVTAEFVLNANLEREVARQPLDSERIKMLLEQARAEQVALDKPGLGFTLQKSLNSVMEQLAERPQDWELVRQAAVAVELANSVGLPVNLWHAQNIYYDMAHKYLPDAKNLPHQWLVSFLVLAEKLCVLVDQYKFSKPKEKQELLLAS
jgi:hypothetical protein